MNPDQLAYIKKIRFLPSVNYVIMSVTPIIKTFRGKIKFYALIFCWEKENPNT